MNILICDPVGQSGMDYLTGKGYTVLYQPEITPDELLAQIPGVQALVVRSRTKITPEVIKKAGKLKVIGRSGTGVDNIDVSAAQENGIVVVNAPGANAESVAEHTVALMFAIARDIVHTASNLSGGVWSKSVFRGMELKGKTLGVVGYGHIGKRVTEIGAGIGMNVLVFSRTPSDDRAHELDSLRAKEATLSQLLEKSDFVTLHIPLSDDTRGFIGKDELNLMKPIAYLINTSRGAVVDEQALIEALGNGQIAGAALDVFTTEPLPQDSLLCGLPNVILTPHVAADSRESEERASLMVAEDIDRVLQGAAAVHAVHSYG